MLTTVVFLLLTRAIRVFAAPHAIARANGAARRALAAVWPSAR